MRRGGGREGREERQAFAAQLEARIGGRFVKGDDRWLWCCVWTQHKVRKGDFRSWKALYGGTLMAAWPGASDEVCSIYPLVRSCIPPWHSFSRGENRAALGGARGAARVLMPAAAAHNHPGALGRSSEKRGGLSMWQRRPSKPKPSYRVIGAIDLLPLSSNSVKHQPD